MNYALNFSKLAVQDLREACAWYDEQKPGLSDLLLEELQLMVDKIAENPQRFALKQGAARMALLKKFPYKVFYVVNEARKSVRVIALIHRARAPKIWKERL